MSRKLFLSLLLATTLQASAATSYTEFYTQTTANNLNAGSTTDDSANSSYAGGTWVAATGVFTAVTGNPTTDTGVTNGAWASVYTTAGATVATCVGRITNTTITTITLDLATISGSAANPSAAGGATTCKVGGAWKGPNAGVGFPWNFIAANSTNSANLWPCVNIKSNALYSVTSGITHSLPGPVRFQGYGATVRDGTKANIDGGTSTIVLFTSSGTPNLDFVDLIFSNNGNSGVNNLVSITGADQLWLRCVAHDSRGHGFTTSAAICMSECEAYLCNKANNDPGAGFNSSSGRSLFERCISHGNNSTVKADGFYISADGGALINCISESNGRNGLNVAAQTSLRCINCDFYNNATNGISLGAANISVLIKNCNFVKNGVYGILQVAGNVFFGGEIENCGFGSGSEANGLGDINSPVIGINVIGSLSYASGVTPWTAPATGNFTITLPAAKSAGRGAFTETKASYSGTVSYPDIGAAQSASTNSGAAYTFSQ